MSVLVRIVLAWVLVVAVPLQGLAATLMRCCGPAVAGVHGMAAHGSPGVAAAHAARAPSSAPTGHAGRASHASPMAHAAHSAPAEHAGQSAHAQRSLHAAQGIPAAHASPAAPGAEAGLPDRGETGLSMDSPSDSPAAAHGATSHGSSGPSGCSPCAACCALWALPTAFRLPEAAAPAHPRRAAPPAPVPSQAPDTLDRPPRRAAA
ncbi:hypothetical protein [Piscinibacter sakaiensis]|uniref:Putative Fe-S oxidoreductase n=1 Tax=Piscinibacter sakaiensis TaxID=1547922 RepID=A0A0K8P223_PISS1|nr:hypothetical protein [Piscinibacter sakaiensis]GAP36722.1 putative Fe-S oxidoreductase [Piscinibacter sakaiensis]